MSRFPDFANAIPWQCLPVIFFQPRRYSMSDPPESRTVVGKSIEGLSVAAGREIAVTQQAHCDESRSDRRRISGAVDVIVLGVGRGDTRKMADSRSDPRADPRVPDFHQELFGDSPGILQLGGEELGGPGPDFEEALMRQINSQAPLSGGDNDGSEGGFDSEASIRQMDPHTPFGRPETVRKEARTRAENIFRHYSLLNAILCRHEAKIQKRWTGKTRSQRLVILLAAWPSMVASHRPDFAALRQRSSTGGPRAEGKHRESFMWPYINQEDLLQPANLPLLLNARGRHAPAAFAGADFEATHLGRVTKNLKPVFLNQHVMVLHGANNAEEYGRLLSWEDHEDDFEWLHTSQQFHPGEGLMILEIQDRLLAFLVGCCKQILHDIPAEEMTSDQFPIVPEPLHESKNPGGLDSLVALVAEAPYRVPAKLNMDRIVSLLEARASAAEDHVWALREDPAYFVQYQAEMKEHRQELIKDTRGNDHPTLSRGRIETFWARVSGHMVIEAYENLEFFSNLAAKARALRDMQAIYKDEISVETKTLPDEYMAALLRFRYYLNHVVGRHLSELKVGVSASPPWRSMFVREAPLDATTTKMKTMLKPIKKTKVQTQLLWLLSTLWDDGNDLFLARLPLVLDELERLLATEAEARTLVSSRIAKVVGDLSIISVCLGQLELFQPWARGFENAMVDKEEEIKTEYQNELVSVVQVVRYDLNKQHVLSRIGRLSDPADRRFFYPSEKRRTRETIDALYQAEHHLDEFWNEVDSATGSDARTGCQNRSAIRKFFDQPRTLRRTIVSTDWPESSEYASQSQAKARKNEALDPALAVLYRPMSNIYIGERINEPSYAPPKQKIKTSKSQTPAPAEPTEPTTAPEPASRTETIPVDARSLKVFRVLFHNPEVTSSPGEVPWTDFLHAMTSAGQFTVEKLYGSAWQFSRTAGGDQSRILFHEPHPHKKLPFTMARRIGRRLTRSYGWEGATFVLREK
ncbi:uncharacterized protein B0I36DRAFT_400351 [Microdochium trichocladiopsis]|uniref:Uncharacterized protein n=1 Tax=Microdochium trichocladiopsis TaxID=1682393 RepID=A0A9P8XTT1_9PEZI|nr:uncharacterized protein B0I36DRAFT_400351 [Microdochium trichocladiopsis]KAH7012268.1 hypothetical protein B0I36DRAFT_400351 [Microdochium trichocladiopsis]